MEKEKADELVRLGQFEYLNESKVVSRKIIKENVEITGEEIKEYKPNMSWTERKIKKWIIDNKVDVEYNISSDTKKEKLSELKEKGYI